MNGYIYHHGILGMKWGKRNGPPYPIDPKDHSASEKKAGWKKSLSEDNPQKQDDENRSNTRRNTAAKIGIIAGTAAIAAIGGYALYKNGTFDKLVDQGKKRTTSLPGLSGTVNGRSVLEDTAQKLGVDILHGYDKMSSEAILSRCNPNLDKRVVDLIERFKTPDDLRKLSPSELAQARAIVWNNREWLNNCTFCTTAYELMKRGLDVSAGPSMHTKQYTEIMSWFKGGKFDFFSVSDWSELTSDAMRKYPDGSRGNLAVWWKNPADGGHSLIWEIANGDFIIRDGQRNASYKSIAEIQSALKNVNMSNIAMMRTDNLELNIPEIIQSGVIDELKRVRR